MADDPKRGTHYSGALRQKDRRREKEGGDEYGDAVDEDAHEVRLGLTPDGPITVGMHIYTGEVPRALSRVIDSVERSRQAAAAVGAALASVEVDVTPQMARSVQAQVNFVRDVEKAHGLLSSAEAGRRMGSRSKTPRNTATQARAQGRLIGIEQGRYVVFPGFQFDQGGLRPVMEALISVGRENGYDEMSLLAFLCSPNSYVEGDLAPVSLIEGDPDRLLDVTRQALGVRW